MREQQRCRWVGRLHEVRAAARKKAVKAAIVDGPGYLKEQVLDNLVPIANALLKDAKEGKTTTVKLMWDLGRVGRETAASTDGARTLSEVLLEELRQRVGESLRK